MANTKDPRKRRGYNLKYLYGITLDQFEGWLEEQGGRCPICLILAAEARDPFVVDHDHACCPGMKSCGTCVRGIICKQCNLALGHLRDNEDAAQRLADYVKQMNSIRKNRDGVADAVVRTMESIGNLSKTVEETLRKFAK